MYYINIISNYKVSPLAKPIHLNPPPIIKKLPYFKFGLVEHPHFKMWIKEETSIFFFYIYIYIYIYIIIKIKFAVCYLFL